LYPGVHLQLLKVNSWAYWQLDGTGVYSHEKYCISVHMLKKYLRFCF